MAMNTPGKWQQSRTLHWWQRALLRIDLFIRPIWIETHGDNEH
jgi:hypothetical protein